MNIRNEIKAQIIHAGMTMQEVVDLLSDEYGWSDSVSNLSAKLQRKVYDTRKYWSLPLCLVTTSYGRKDGRSDTPATALRISRPHRRTAVLPMDSSERYGFRCHRLQEMFRRTASCRRADKVKGADILPWSAEVTAVTAFPSESPRRAHGTL